MENINAITFQKELFRYIIVKSGEKKAVNDLSELLHLNKSSVYNRINGTTLLKVDELLILLQTSGFQMDSYVFQRQQTTLFQFGFLDKRVQSCTEYLENILNIFKIYSNVPKMRVWFVVNTLPFFHLMNFRELALFKLFVYCRINWQLSYTENLIFDPDTFPERAVYDNLVKPILNLYSGLDTIEFWPDDLYLTTLKQIQYFNHSGQMKNLALLNTLHEQLDCLCEHQNKMAKEGRKWPINDRGQEKSGQFDLFHNEVASMNFTLLAESDLLKGVFTVYDDPNFMFNDDAKLFDYTLALMHRLRAKSTRISEESEQNRKAYFLNIKAEIGHFRQKL